jgi:hypothetical protein
MSVLVDGSFQPDHPVYQGRGEQRHDKHRGRERGREGDPGPVFSQLGLDDPGGFFSADPERHGIRIGIGHGGFDKAGIDDRDKNIFPQEP